MKNAVQVLALVAMMMSPWAVKSQCGSGVQTQPILFECNDSYGDGWNGCGIAVYQGGQLLSTVSLQNGSYGEYNVEVCLSGDSVYFVWVSGSWPSEVSFSIRSADSAEIISGGGSNLSNGDTIAAYMPVPLSVYYIKSLMARAITATSVTLDWIDPYNTDATYSLTIINGYDTVRTFTGLGSTSVTIDSLEPSTPYTATIRACTASGECSAPITTVFYTHCNTPVTLPYFETWDNLPNNDPWANCWIHLYKTSPSQSGTYYTSEHNGQYGTVMRMRHDADTFAIASAAVPLPGNRINVRFWGYMQNGWLQVGVMTDLDDFGTFIPLVTAGNDWSWTEYEFNTINLDSNATYHVVWMGGTDNNGWQQTVAYIDDINISEYDADCMRPQQVSVDSVTPYGATFHWSAAGEGASYRVYYKTDPYGSYIDSLTTSDTVVTITNLRPQTTYYASVGNVCDLTPGGLKQFPTFSTPLSCARVQNLRIEDLSYTAARIAWDYDTMNGYAASGVRIILNNYSNPTYTPAYYFTDSTDYTITRLEHSSEYEVVVASICPTVGGRVDTSQTTSLRFTTLGCTADVGDGQFQSIYLPTYNFYGNSYTQMLYPASEMPNIDTIQRVFFNVVTPSSTVRSMDIYMGLVDQTVFDSSMYIPLDSLTLVASNVSLSMEFTGWKELLLDSAFVYDSIHTFVIAVNDHTNSWTTAGRFAGHESPGRGLYSYRDSYPYVEPLPTSGTLYNIVPDLRFSSYCHIPVCVAPMPQLVATTADGAPVIRWMHLGTENAYLPAYKKTDDSAYTLLTPITDTAFTFTTLANSSHYQLRIGSLCGEDTLWSKPIRYITPCGGVTIPWVSDFEGDEPGDIPMCWSRVMQTDYYGTTYPRVIDYSNGHVVSFQGEGYSLLVSEAIPLRGDSIDIRFRARRDNWSGWRRVGVMTDPYDTSTFIPLIDINSYDWQDYTIYTTGLDSTATYHLAFFCNSPNNGVSAYIDDIHVKADNGCRLPQLNTWWVDSTHASIYFYGEGTETDYVVQYWADGSDELHYANATQEITDWGNGYFRITNLQSSTNYLFRIGSICGADTLWVDGIYSFGTTATCPTITGLTVAESTPTAITFSWNSNPDYYSEYQILIDSNVWYYTTDTTFTLTGLDEGQTHTFSIQAYCPSIGFWCEPQTITATTPLYPVIEQYPYTTYFDQPEDKNAWMLLNGGTNQWYIGNAVGNGDSHSMYISKDGGLTNSYNTSSSLSINYAMHKLLVTEEADFLVTFDWRAYGESSYDYLRAWIAPADIALSAGLLPNGSTGTSSYTNTTPDGWQSLGEKMNLDSTWNTRQARVHLTPGLYKLVFMWCNDNSAGTQPPIAVDNLNIQKFICPMVSSVTIDTIDIHSVSLHWTDTVGGDVTYSIVDGDQTLASGITDTSYTFTGLTANSDYTVSVVRHCSASEVSCPYPVSFTTLCEVMPLPYTCSFEQKELDVDGMPYCWHKYNSVGGSYPYTSTSYVRTGSRSLYFYCGAQSSYADTMMAILPGVDVDNYPMTNNHLVFFTSSTTNTSDSLLLQVGTMSNPLDPTTFTADSVLVLYYEYKTEHIVPLAIHSPATNRYPALLVLKPSRYRYLYIDDLLLNVIPTCQRPTGFTYWTTNSSSAISFMWHVTAADAWELEFTTADTTFYVTATAADVSIDADSNVHYTVHGLQPNTDYRVRLRSVCGQEHSYWTPDPIGCRTYNDECHFVSFSLSTIQRDVTVIDTAERTIIVPIYHSDNLADEEGEYTLSLYSGIQVFDIAGNLVNVNTFRDLMRNATPNIPLMVRVYAEDPAIYSDWTLTFVGEACTRISDFTYHAERTALNLSWEETDHSINSFQLVFSATPLSSDALETAEKIDLSVKNYRVEGLERETTYYVYLRADCGYCTSAWSAYTVKTAALVECHDHYIGDTLSTLTTYNHPLNNFYNYTLTQTIITAEELDGMRSIESLSYNYVGSSPVTVKNDVSIYLQPTSKNVFTSNNDLAPFDTNAVLVYSGPMNVTRGWNVLTFDVPYERDTTENLLIIVDDNSGHYNGSSYVYQASPTEGYMSIDWYSDSYNPNLITPEPYSGSKNVRNYRPLIRLFGCVTTDACPAVTRVTVDSIGTDSAVVHWTASDADYLNHYEVFVSPTALSDPDAWTGAYAYSGTDLRCVLTGLNAYTDYYVYVRANCVNVDRDEGTSTWVETSFHTFSECRTPINVEATLTGKHTASISWQEQGATVGQPANYEYILSLAPLTDSLLESHPLTASGIADTTVSLTGLSSDVTYYVYVRNHCTSGVSPWMSTTFTTYEEMPAVLNLHMEGVSYNAMTAVWERDVERFAAEEAWVVALTIEGEEPVVWDTVNESRKVFYNLMPDTNYRVYVMAFDTTTGAMSDTVSVGAHTLTLPNDCAVIAAGTASNEHVPLYGVWTDHHQRIQSIYPEAMLDSINGKTLTSMTYTVSSGSSSGWNTTTWEVWMGVTLDTNLADGWADTSVLSLVYTGTLSASVSEGMSITLDQPFVYSGGNLLVQFVQRGHTSYSSCSFVGTPATSASRYAYPDNNSDLMAAVGTIQDFLPQVQFCYVRESNCYSISNVFFSDVTAHSAQASWYPGNAESQWEVAVDSGQTTVVDTLTILLDNLNADRNYLFLIRPVCGNDEYGSWSSFNFTTPPSCGLPDTLWADNVTATSADLHAGSVLLGTPQGYTFRYWIDGGDTLSVTSTQDYVTVTNLMSDQTYYYDIMVNCGDDGSSRWTYCGTLHTPCGTVELPYYHDFSWYNGCWTFVSDNAANSVAVGSYCYGYGLRFSSAMSTHQGTYNQYAFSPLVNSDTVTPLMFSFHYATEGSNNRLWVGYTMDEETLDPDGYTWSNNYYTTTDQCSWQRGVLLLPAGVKRVAIRYHGTHAGNAYLYNVNLSEPAIYNVTANVDTAKGIFEGQTGMLYEASLVSLSITNKRGYRFYSWNDPWGNVVSYENPYVFALEYDMNLVASFITGKYDVTAVSSNTTMGYVTGGGRAEYLTPMTLVATPYYGYHFVEWSNGIQEASATVLADTDMTLVAYFDYNRYAIVAMSADTVMGVVSGSDTVNYLTTVTLTATPHYGYRFVGWSSGDTASSISIQAIENRNLTANFTYRQFAVTGGAADGAMGMVDGSATVNYLSPVTLTANPFYGYHFTHWSTGDTTTTITLTATQDTAVVAFFERNQYTVTSVSADTVMGTVGGSTTALYLDTVTLTATANYGYHFTGWSNGDTAATLRVVVTGAINLTANFTYNQYTVSGLTANPGMGSVSGSATVNYLTPVTLTATPFYAYRFVGWTGDVDATQMSSPSVTLIADSNRVVTAYFDTIAYDVSAFVNDTLMGVVSGADSTKHFATAHLVATANYGYHFVHWTNAAGNVLGVVNILNISPISDTAVTAVFAPNQYTVSGVTADSNMGAVTGTSTVNYLTEVTLTATPTVCYHFTSWSTGDTTESITLSAIRDTAVVAYFAPNIYTGGETHTVCDSYLWNDSTYSVSGTYPVALLNANGCDSTATLVLTVNYSHTSNESATDCDSYLWHDSLYTTGGLHIFDTLTTLGCDSTISLNLTLHYSHAAIESITACDSYLWHDSLYTVDGSGIFDTLTTFGCDSTVTLDLTLHYSHASSESITACDSYLWHNSLYTSGGLYAFDTLTTFGCDSTVTLDLTLHYSHASSESITACDSYLWHNSLYTSGGLYAFDTLTTFGCDSTVTLDLTLHYSHTSSESTSACDSYLWHDSLYTTSGLYSFDTLTTFGCDSTVTLDLTLHYSVSTALDTTAPVQFFWEDSLYTESTVIVSHYSTIYGCDSIVTVDLTVIPYYTLLLEADSTMGTVTGGGYYAQGSVVNIIAEPLEHRHFVAWSDGVVDNPRDVTVDSNITLTALFDYDSVMLLLSVGDSAGGTINPEAGSYTLHVDDELVIIATPDEYHQFAGWLLDGQLLETTDSVFTLVVTPEMAGSTISLVATFSAITSIAPVEADGFTVTAVGNRIIVGDLKEKDLFIYDVSGRCLQHRTRVSGTIEYTVVSAGVYLVKVGTAPARRVVIIGNH